MLWTVATGCSLRTFLFFFPPFVYDMWAPMGMWTSGPPSQHHHAPACTMMLPRIFRSNLLVGLVLHRCSFTNGESFEITDPLETQISMRSIRGDAHEIRALSFKL